MDTHDLDNAAPEIAPVVASLNPPVAQIVTFLESIGLPVRLAEISETTFLPGIATLNGTLTVDVAKLLYPGDLLHEAGHLALLPPSQRAHAHGRMDDDGGFEMGAIAWSYAAALHIGLPPAVVFHDDGYKGGAQALLENFSAGRYIGVPMLEWTGLSAREIQPYPHIVRWLREE